MAALQFIGEEYNTRTGLKAVVDGGQDIAAKAGAFGLTAAGFAPIEEKMLPQSLKKGNIVQKGMALDNPLNNDIGPGNIELRTALQAMGKNPFSNGDRNQIAKMLTTNAGTAEALAILVNQTQDALGNLGSARTDREKAQLLVNALREGHGDFLDRVQSNRGLTDGQMDDFLKDPTNFTKPDGTKPPAADNVSVDDDRFDQVDSILEERTNDDND